jgi:hypothetical protein
VCLYNDSRLLFRFWACGSVREWPRLLRFCQAINMYRTLALAAALAPVTGFAPALRATARSVALKAKYTDANGNPIKAALSAYMHFCNDERATVTAQQKRLAGDSFKQTLVMTKLGALWRELPEAQKATYNQKARRGVDINQWVRLSTSTPSSRRRNGIVVASMAWSVGRPTFDFHTGQGG